MFQTESSFMYSEFGISGAMRALGVTWDTVAAWEASCKRILGLLEDHLKVVCNLITLKIFF